MVGPGRTRNLELDPINLTPLLDCILNLIFFFLLATTIKEYTEVIEVQLPRADSGVARPEIQKEIVLSIARNGSIFFGEDAVTTAQLKARLATMAQEPDKAIPVRVRSDGDARVQTFYGVISICRESGYPTFQFEARPKERGP